MFRVPYPGTHLQTDFWLGIDGQAWDAALYERGRSRTEGRGMELQRGAGSGGCCTGEAIHPAVTAVAGKVFQAVGVAPPPTAREAGRGAKTFVRTS